MNAGCHPAPGAQELLRGEITEVCARIDRRLHNRAGTAERGLWFWLWPPVPEVSTEVLTALHGDAVTFLHTLTAPKETP